MTDPQKYVSMQLTAEVRQRLQRSQLTLSAEVGERLTLSAVVLAALAVAEKHPKELLAALKADS